MAFCQKISCSSIVKSKLPSVRYLKEVTVPYVNINICVILYYVLYINIINITINDLPVRHVSNCVGHLQGAVNRNEVFVFYCTCTTSPTAIISIVLAPHHQQLSFLLYLHHITNSYHFCCTWTASPTVIISIVLEPHHQQLSFLLYLHHITNSYHLSTTNSQSPITF